MILNIIMLSAKATDFRKRLCKASEAANKHKTKDFFDYALDIINAKKKFFDGDFYPSSQDKINGEGWNKILENHSKNTEVLIDTFGWLCIHMVAQLRIEDMDSSSFDKYKILIAEIEKLQNYNKQPGEN